MEPQWMLCQYKSTVWTADASPCTGARDGQLPSRINTVHLSNTGICEGLMAGIGCPRSLRYVTACSVPAHALRSRRAWRMQPRKPSVMADPSGTYMGSGCEHLVRHGRAYTSVRPSLATGDESAGHGATCWSSSRVPVPEDRFAETGVMEGPSVNQYFGAQLMLDSLLDHSWELVSR